MSEIPQPIPNPAIQDIDLAWDMAHTQKPFLEVERRMNEVGETEVANKVAVQGLAAIEELEHNHPKSTEQAREPLTSPETNRSQHEKLIAEATEETIAVFDMWFEGMATPIENHTGSRQSFMKVYTNPDVANVIYDNLGETRVGFMPKDNGGDIRKDIIEWFDNEDIPEVVLISPEIPKTKFGITNPNSKYKEDPLVVVRYQTVAKPYGKYDYTGGGRGGSYMRAQIFLPKTLANQLSQAIQEDPAIIREMITKVMEDRVQAGEDWDKSRPPYEEWNKINEGNNKMMLYVGDFTYIEDGKVLEWQTPVSEVA
jgi:hypothetical protein